MRIHRKYLCNLSSIFQYRGCERMVAFLRACVAFGCIVELACVAFLVSIAYLEQIIMTKKSGDKNSRIDRA